MTDELIPNERERIAAIPGACVNTNLRRASRVVSGFYNDIFHSTGLHANQMMLLVPLYLGGPTPIALVAERLGLDRTTLQRNLKLVEARGLISIRPGEDLRTRIVSLTEKGRRTLAEAVPLWEEAQRQVIALLGPQHTQLMSILADLAALDDG